MSELDQRRAAAREAQQRFDEIEARRRVALRKAEAEINAALEPERQAARDEINAAQRALAVAMDRTPDHPWTGKRVYRTEPQGRSWERLPDKQIEGVVETRRSNTQFPLNAADYRLPSIGSGFVRLLNKDGKPGLKFEELQRSWNQWKLADEAEASLSPSLQPLPDEGERK